MKVHLLILGLLALQVFGKKSVSSKVSEESLERELDQIKKGNPKYKDAPWNNPIHAEFTPPTKVAEDELYKIRNLNILDFYVALEELYLTGGFDKTGTINAIILGQKSIPDKTFKTLYEVLKATRSELKRGDSSLSAINNAMTSSKDAQLKDLLKSVKSAIRAATGTSDTQTFLDRISKIKLNSVQDLKALNLQKGQGQVLASLLEELKSTISAQDLATISRAVQNAFYDGVGGTNDVRDAVVAGARLMENMPSQDVPELCAGVGIAELKRPGYDKALDGALEMVKRLNRTNSKGEPGYKLLMDLYFDKKAPSGNMIFLPTKLIDLKTMVTYFKAIQRGNPEILSVIMDKLAKDKYRMPHFQWWLDLVQDDKLASGMMSRRFGEDISGSETEIYRSLLENITYLSVDSAYFLRNLKSISDIIDTKRFEPFMAEFIDLVQLSRGQKWRDSWVALKEASDILVPFDTDHVRPFQGLRQKIGDESYEEVFTAWKMILGDGDIMKIKEKCKFIGHFYNGLEDKKQVMKAIGIQPTKYQKWIDSTEYIDALTDVLKASGTFKNLNTLLDYHGKWTTVDKKPLESMDLIDNFIRYLDQSARYNKKKSG